MIPSTYTVQPSPHAQREFLGYLIQAIPGDVIELAAGKFDFDMDLELSTANITIRGKGMDKTILSFKNQHMGAKGIEATGDNFVIQDLAVEDTRGNAIKVVGAKNVTFKDVRTEWTGGPKTSNGAYGVYPVSCENVLIDGCVVRGAADAGVYVGQSRHIIVKNCKVDQNVAGIEIENSFDADVFDNYATNNSGGILVFDLPGLEVHNGGRVRVFHNQVPKNNHPNFGPPAPASPTWPRGRACCFWRWTTSKSSTTRYRQQYGRPANHQLHPDGQPDQRPALRPLSRARLHPRQPHLRRREKSGGPLWKNARGPVGQAVSEIFYDGVLNPKHLKDGKLPPELGIRFNRNGDVRFANIHFDKLTPENTRRAKPTWIATSPTTRGAFRRFLSSPCRRTALPIRPAT